ncbi:MAG: GvpL/GvpF family gas vesicle protein [Chloroflexota bacterium]
MREVIGVSWNCLYAIIGSQDKATPGLTWSIGSAAARTVMHQEIGCVVGDWTGGEVKALPKEELVRCLLIHQRVIERIMADCTVLPVKFGTILMGPREVRCLLSQGHSLLEEALSSVRDKVEIEVAATWDARQVLQEVGKEGEVVRAREAVMGGGQPTVEQRVQLGRVVKACLDRRRERCREEAVSFLKPVSVAFASNTLMSDEMVMNLAFLVERARRAEFDDRVQRLDDLFQNRINFRIIGPLPPYSFSMVEVTRLTPSQVEEARQALQLGDGVSQAEVRRAYRRLAAAVQRDLGPADKVASERVARLRQASELLVAYCRARGQANRDSLADQYAGSLFAISIKGSSAQEIEAARFGGAERV